MHIIKLFFICSNYRFRGWCLLPSFLLITSVCFLITLICFSKALPDDEYSNLFSETAFSSKSSPGKTSLPVKNSYFLKFSDDKAEILAVCLSKMYWALFSSILLDCFDFLTVTRFIKGSFKILIDDLTKLYCSLKMNTFL